MKKKIIELKTKLEHALNEMELDSKNAHIGRMTFTDSADRNLAQGRYDQAENCIVHLKLIKDYLDNEIIRKES